MRVLVVDDEPIARARIARMLGRIDGAEAVGEAGDGVEALAQVAALRPDVLVLDIDMPKLDGLAVAEDPSAPAVIFTTAHAQHALDAFELDAFDYLLKPIGRDRLARALDKVRARRGPSDEPWRIVVRDGSVKRFVDARAVDAFHSDHKYVSFCFEGETLLCRESLDGLEARLAELGFLRVNRGALVRRDAVAAYDAAAGGAVVLRDGARVPVSRRAAASIRQALGVA